jgi:ABC-type cobalamin/Fe3+-siderophores transport system ATPase subunit
MEIKLPRRQYKDKGKPFIVDSGNIVVIGANGSGKSSFGREIKKQYPESTLWISGMHALFINAADDDIRDFSELDKLASFVRNRINAPKISEYERLMLRLQSEEFEAAIKYKEESKKNPALTPPETKIDIIQKIWEKMFPHCKMVRKAGVIELTSVGAEGDTYNSERMSDGEKITFYLIGAILYAPKNSILIVEEPEILLHNSIKNPLWNEIEDLRQDCTFVYLTHDIEFSISRKNARRFWLKSFDADNRIWDYEEIKNQDNIPEELFIEILGNRKPVLFIEGTYDNSIDNKLYPLIFPDYMVKPMGGCQKVIEVTKAFREVNELHTLESKGIVDRDRRTEGEIKYLNEKNIYVPNVAEVENLLLLEPVIRTVARRMMKNENRVFEEVKSNIIELFRKDIDTQVLLHTRHKVQKRLETILNIKMNCVEQLTYSINAIHKDIDVKGIYHKFKSLFFSFIKNKDYASILKVFNQKSILPQCRLCNLCGLNNKESYLNLILSILKGNDEDSEIIRNAIKESLGIIPSNEPNVGNNGNLDE